MPSARPRKSDSEPSVTISGGMPSAAISVALSAPPAHPAASAAAAAPGAAPPQPRDAAPNITAASPIIAPTDRSMPPVTTIGVIATASRPTSTLTRITSKAFATLRKFGATIANTTISTAIAPASARLDTGGGARPCRAHGTRAARETRRVDRDGGEDDHALQRTLPLRAHAEKRQCRPDGAEQHDAEQRAGHRAAAAGHCGAADNHRGDHFHLESQPGVARNLVEAHRVQDRGGAGEDAADDECRQLDGGGVDPGQPRCLMIRSGREYSPSGGEVAEDERGHANEDHDHRARDEREPRLRDPEPLKTRRQVFDPGALCDPAQAVAQR